MDNEFQFESKLKKAKDYEVQGKYLHSIQIYTALINDNPDHGEVYSDLAEIYEKLGKQNVALELLKSYLKKVPDDNEFRLYFGQYLLRNSKWDEAIEILSLISFEEEPIAYFFVGYCHFILKEYEQSKIYFENFIDSKEQTDLIHEAYIYLAKIYIKLKDYGTALQYAKKAEGVYSNYWELNYLFAVIYFNLNMHTHAVLPIEKALKLNPKEPSVFEWAGNIYLKLGDFLKAKKQFLKYVESIDNASTESYTKLADACLNLEYYKDAINYYEIALKLNPENSSAKKGKAKASSILKHRVSDA